MLHKFGHLWRVRAALLLWLCCTSLHVGAEDPITDPVEVKALQAIKRSLVDPYNNLSNWNHGDPCTSNWTGISCFNTTLTDGYLHVQELQLINMNLSGSLSPELGSLSYMTILDFMWNDITGSIPKEIGNITSLLLLLLNGNQLTGPLPEELGYLSNLDRIQIDQNQISGPIPKSFANMSKAKHFHMNNNSISGQIPPELSTLQNLVHLLLDNNNLKGYLPEEFDKMPRLRILQLDNNHFDGNTIPDSYGNMSNLLKLSLRNCSLRGPIPDLSRIPKLSYLDLSSNQLNGSIPPNKLAENITTIDLSNNNLTGPIPINFSGLPRLQRLSVANNSLSGFIRSSIWQNRTFSGTEKLILELQNNRLSNISGSIDLPSNVTLWLQGNPVCSNANVVKFCGSESENDNGTLSSTNSTECLSQSCPPPYEYSPMSPISCFCAAPLLVGYRLKSPGFSDFYPYRNMFQDHLTIDINLYRYQMYIDSFEWQKGPRLRMYLKFFPVYNNGTSDSHIFNRSEVRRIRRLFTGWQIRDSELFGPFELLNFTLLDPYKDAFPTSKSSSISKGAVVGIVLGAIAIAVTLSAIFSLLILRVHFKDHHPASKRGRNSKSSIKVDGIRCFTYEEMALATNNFNSSTQVGHGGYGNVYRGTLANGTVVAIKRAEEGSLQGEKEFSTELEFLSRLHHRNLVPLIGYCDEEDEQMLVYEFMSNGSLRDQLSAKAKEHLSLAMRLNIALGSAKGILYLHKEADPPIFHRDIKASNILLDSKFNAKVADFGLSRLAPVPDIEGMTPAHVSTVVKGTPGYLDPEYFLTHKLTDKSDVYSLGVVFLELLTGLHPISHGKNIVREVNAAYQSGTIFRMIDEGMGSYRSECIEKLVTLALRCCKEETNSRPSTPEVVHELENIWQMMPESDTKPTRFVTNETGDMVWANPSSMKYHDTSTELSGSDLVSGVVPTIKPR